MALNDFVKGIRGKLSGAVDSAKAAAKDIDIQGAKDKLKEAVDSAQSAVQDIQIPDVKDAVAQIRASFQRKEDDTEDQDESEVLEIKTVSTRCAMKIIYYLMAADGEVFHSEEEKFDSIGNELDPDFSKKKESITGECQAQLDKVIDPDDYYEVLQDGVEDALLASRPTADSFITPKLLVWNLLTIAYSDENYDETERKLIKYIVRKTNIDKAVFLEMESSILTLMDIEKELSWIKTTDRPYLVIEAMVNELADRKNVIFESVKDLIAL